MGKRMRPDDEEEGRLKLLSLNCCIVSKLANTR
jgi:hypothetical protein